MRLLVLVKLWRIKVIRVFSIQFTDIPDTLFSLPWTDVKSTLPWLVSLLDSNIERVNRFPCNRLS